MGRKYDNIYDQVSKELVEKCDEMDIVLKNIIKDIDNNIESSLIYFNPRGIYQYSSYNTEKNLNYNIKYMDTIGLILHNTFNENNNDKLERIDDLIYKYKYKEIRKELYICKVNDYSYIVFEMDDVIKNELLKKLIEDIIKESIHKIYNYLTNDIQKDEYEDKIDKIESLSWSINCNYNCNCDENEDIRYKIEDIESLITELKYILDEMYDKTHDYKNNPEYYKDFVKPIIKKNIEELINKKDSHDIIEDLNKISSTTYEGKYCYSNLFIPNEIKDLDKLEYSFRFESKIKIKDYKDIRKSLELGCDEYILVGSIDHIYGIAKKDELESITGINIAFDGNYSYYISKSLKKEEGIYFKYGYPINKDNRFSKEILINSIKENFEESRELDEDFFDQLYQICERATKQSKGTILVISSEAESEAKRLKSQSTSIENPIDLKSNLNLVSNITNIDGAVLISLDGKCYSIGMILDGVSKDDIGDKRRGSRYNSTVKYINFIHEREDPKTRCLAIVISEDGMIDIVDHKHINRNDEKKIKISSLEDKNDIDIKKGDTVYCLDRDYNTLNILLLTRRDFDEETYINHGGMYTAYNKFEFMSNVKLKIINNGLEKEEYKFRKSKEINKIYKYNKLIHFKRNEDREVIEINVYNIQEDGALYIDKMENNSEYIDTPDVRNSIDRSVLTDIIKKAINKKSNIRLINNNACLLD